MPEIRLEHITKRWGKFYGVDDLNLVIENNAFVTLLGPSGCGKTTTLRMIAGLETPTSGRITIGDTVVFDSELGINIPANKRKVGFLFQNYALWPNMTVYQNISFGLSNIKEEMPKISFEAKNAARLAQILKNPQDVVKTLEECRDKNGKLDETKAIIKLIDTYTISQYTAQKLFGYHLEQGKDVSAEVKALEEKVEAARKAQPFNENFELLKDGEVETAVRKLTKEEIDLSVRRVSRIVKISMFMDRYPAELSGGQQQRVAIARALVNRPKVLLLDEPLGALDLRLRKDMQNELKRIQQQMGITFIYVTHDQEEALTMSDTVVVMDKGRIQQIGTPEDIYNEPKNAFVADFIGESNILNGTIVRDNVVKMYGKEFPCVDGGFEENEPVDVVIRPEDIDIVPVEQGQLVGTVTNVTFKGMQYDIIVDFRGFKWLIQTTDHSPVGARIGVKIDPDGFHIMKKSEYSGLFGDYSSYSEEYEELADAGAEPEEEESEDEE